MAKKRGGSNAAKGGSKAVSGTEKKKSKRGNAKKGGRSKNNHSSYYSDDEDIQFRNQLTNQGHLIREMNSDGNCLFRSLSDQLYCDDGDEHGTVRKEICDYIKKHKDEFQSFLLMDEDDEDIMNIDDYVDHMREYTTWGSDIEIVAASRKYMRGIKVFSTHFGVLRFDCPEENRDKNSDDLLLSYHENDHYNSVYPIDGSNRQKTQKQQPQEGKRNRKKAKNNLSVESAEEENDANQQNNTSKKVRPPKRGSPCPCGSGLTYKKCCFAREKAKKRVAKTNTSDAQSEEDKKKEEFIGEFKVLNI